MGKRTSTAKTTTTKIVRGSGVDTHGVDNVGDEEEEEEQDDDGRRR